MVTLATKLSDITGKEILLFGLPILFGLMIISLALYGIAKHKRNSEDDAQPLLEENAKVIDKQQVAPNTIVFEIWIVFETETGKRVRLFCKPNDVFIVGDEGRLRWQGTRLYSFELGKRTTPETKTAQSTVYGAPLTSQGYIPAWKRVQMEERKDPMNTENSDG